MPTGEASAGELPAGEASAGELPGKRRPIAFAIVLAGGTGQRMGGASKPDVRVAGRRMLDHVLASLAAQDIPAVVVGPPELEVPDGVALVREDPPLGGPAAGIAAGHAAGIGAGYAAGRHHVQGCDVVAPGVDVSSQPVSASAAAKLVGILACDAPFAPRVLPDLAAAATNLAESVGAVAITPDGRLQRLLCVVDADALSDTIRRLERNGGVRDRSVRALLGDLSLAPVDVPEWAMDADTPAEVRALEKMSSMLADAATPETSR